MKRRPQVRLLFVTGSGTGVGKTVLTALLLAHLRRSDVPALALKPFCSGGRHDARLLEALQDGDLSIDQINPIWFQEPVAPLVAARAHHHSIRPGDVLRHIRGIAQMLASRPGPAQPGTRLARRPTLLVEGAGGLRAPLAEGFSVLDLIQRLNCEVLVAASNRLGTINHTLLTIEALRHADVRWAKVVLMDTASPDPSSKTNPGVLSELLAPVSLVRLPFLRPCPEVPATIRTHAIRLSPILAALLS